MRARATLLLVVPTLLALAPLGAAAHASEDAAISLAQQPGEDPQVEGGEGQNPEGEGSSEEEAETGAGEGEQEGAAEETGPPWTYQMARISLALLALLALAMGFLYYRLVVQRSRGEV